jgi:translation initiation factor 2 beta subunit (eIF-2beta)/eIF-5
MNTYGKNRFREVRVTCTECNATETTNMQCDTGEYLWDCDHCHIETPHTVEERLTKNNNTHTNE